MSEANLKRTEQRAFYLQNQLNQTIAQLNQLQEHMQMKLGD